MATEYGTIKTWDSDKAFGFITPDGTHQDIFFHITDYSNKHHSPIEGLIVKYVVSKDNKGRRCAKKVIPKSAHKKNSLATKQQNRSLLVFVSFFLFISGLVLFKKLSNVFLLIYLIMSILTFFVYALDKNAAQKNKWRTQEATLHILSFLGGWPGAIYAQYKLRHKSSKTSFKFMFWITVFFNCCVLFLFTKPYGNEAIEALAILFFDLF